MKEPNTDPTTITLIERSAQLSERVLAAEGDSPSREVLQLQHELRGWLAERQTTAGYGQRLRRELED